MTLDECKEILKPWLHDDSDVDPKWWLEIHESLPEIPLDELFILTTSIEARSDWEFLGIEYLKGTDGIKEIDGNYLKFIDSSNGISKMSMTYDEAVQYLNSLKRLM